ncbi:MAG: hypothetical protein AAGA85_19020, partial [Bacteroidota bacterium]
MFRLFITIALCLQMLVASAVATTWTNTSRDGLASNPANWSRGVPGVGDDVLFSGSSGDCEIDIALNVNSINLLSDYTGNVFATVPTISVTGSLQISGGTLDLRNVDLTFSGSSLVVGSRGNGLANGHWSITSTGNVSASFLQPLTIQSLHLNLSDGSAFVLSDSIYADNVQLEDGLLDGGVIRTGAFTHNTTFDGGLNGGTVLVSNSFTSSQLVGGHFPQLIINQGSVTGPLFGATTVIDGDLLLRDGFFLFGDGDLEMENYEQTGGQHFSTGSSGFSMIVNEDFILSGGTYASSTDTTVLAGDAFTITAGASFVNINYCHFVNEGDVDFTVDIPTAISRMGIELSDGSRLINHDTISVQSIDLVDGFLDGGVITTSEFTHESTFDGGLNDATIQLDNSFTSNQLVGGRFPQLIIE